MPKFKEIKRKIESFSKLPIGWHYGDGAIPSARNIRSALSLLTSAKLLGFDRFNAFPGIDGEIQVTVYDGADFYQFTIEPNLELTVVHEHNQDEVFYQERVSIDDALAKLEEFAFQICDLSELYTQNISTQSVEVSAISLLKTPAMVQAYRGSSLIVPFGQAIQYASTSATSIPLQSAESRSFTGSFQMILSSMVAIGNQKLAAPEILATTT